MERLIGKITFNYYSNGELKYSPAAKIYLSGKKDSFRLRLNIQRKKDDYSEFIDDDWNDFIDYAETNSLRTFRSHHWQSNEISSVPWIFWSFIYTVVTNSNNRIPLAYDSKSCHNTYSVFAYKDRGRIINPLFFSVKPFALYKTKDDNDYYAYIDGALEPEITVYRNKITEFFL